jgi:hypothetical protein
MKHTGSLSPSSNDNHAALTPSFLPSGEGAEVRIEIQLLISVVLPKPAEAEMRVSLQPIAKPLFSRSIKRERLTTPGRGWGTYTFVAKIAVAINPLYSIHRERNLISWLLAAKSDHYFWGRFVYIFIDHLGYSMSTALTKPANVTRLYSFCYLPLKRNYIIKS